MKRAALRVGRRAGDSTASSLRMAPTSASKRSTGQELHRMIWRPQRTSAAAEEVAGADGKKYMKCKSGVRLTDRRQILEPGVCRRSYVRLGSVGWRSGASSVVGSIRRLKRSAQDRRRKYVMIWPPNDLLLLSSSSGICQQRLCQQRLCSGGRASRCMYSGTLVSVSC